MLRRAWPLYRILLSSSTSPQEPKRRLAASWFTISTTPQLTGRINFGSPSKLEVINTPMLWSLVRGVIYVPQVLDEIFKVTE